MVGGNSVGVVGVAGKARTRLLIARSTMRVDLRTAMFAVVDNFGWLYNTLDAREEGYLNKKKSAGGRGRL